jgi:N-formylmaleamate deformylase
VVGLIQGLGLAAPVLRGHSMGGMTAAMVANQLAAAIRGVILADPTFLSPERQRKVHESGAVEQHPDRSRRQSAHEVSAFNGIVAS